jgi:hypothetical protein
MRLFTPWLVLAALPLLVGSPLATARDCNRSCNASNASALMSEGLGQVVTEWPELQPQVLMLAPALPVQAPSISLGTPSASGR